MAINILVNLRESSRYLHEVKKGANRDVREDEFTTAELRASAWIQGCLGKTYPETAVPPQVEQMADKMASATIWRFIHYGQAPKDSEYADNLEEEAKEEMQKILDGNCGIVLLDGSFDSDYPGISEGVIEQQEPDEWDIIA